MSYSFPRQDARTPLESHRRLSVSSERGNIGFCKSTVHASKTRVLEKEKTAV